jgi:HD-GYP domain-containing protein (c-di-GMP phosphodiesterase class II)
MPSAVSHHQAGDMSVSRNEQLARMLATNAARHFGIAAHIDQMSRYAEIIARELGMSASRVRLLRGAAKLHDFGKVATPDRILLKPGPLTAGERRVMELHTVIGHDLLRDSDSPFLEIAATVALSHHERWDGAGYPQGLAGDEIPVEARIASVADVFDSLTRARPYRPALKLRPVLELISAGRGTQFDPGVVDAFNAARPEIMRVRSTRKQRNRRAGHPERD